MTVAPILTLEETKAFLNVEHDDDDALIESLILTATETALSHADGLAIDDEIPESVRTAALLHVSKLYGDREGGDHPKASAALAGRYRAWDV